MRRAVLLLLLVGLAVPGPAAQACDTRQVDTIDTLLPTAPSVVAAGRVLSVPVRVTRAGVPATGIEVSAALDGRDFAVYAGDVTDGNGNMVLNLPIPRTARGPLELDVRAYRTVVDLPCAGIEEYEQTEQPWGRAG